MKKAFLTLTFLCFCLLNIVAQQRKEINLKDWQFSRDNQSWEQVRVPHDWAIGGPFDKKWDLQMVAIEQNGETEKTEKSGRSGGLPWIGEGFYRTTYTFDVLPEYAELVFDGAMSEPVVRVNGHEAGRWAYGYNAFRVTITPYLNIGENLIEVSLKNVEESSRWYPGGGLYRPVTLVTSAESHLDAWGLHVYTERIENGTAYLKGEIKVVGDAKDKMFALSVRDKKGALVASCEDLFTENGVQTFEMQVPSANLWSPETPYLYYVFATLYDKNRLTENSSTENPVFKPLDRIEKRLGIRTIAVSKEGGFQLNGVTRKLKGVCLHHDLGPLGAAVNKYALIRQIEILKDMGCDAIRTAHNMPSTMQMEVCDSMGMMVMAESFDMWIYPKCKNGYARFFNEWAEKDITNLVLNHRQHPSIIMWSIGNEIPEQWSKEGVEIATRLQNLCHELDPSRPVTQGLDRIDEALNSGMAQVMDVPGFNYRVHKYDKGFAQLPQGFLLGSETASTVSSRGVYKFPVEVKFDARHDDAQCSSYDVEYCNWSNLPDDDFTLQNDRTWTIGQFVWTGFDYLGEPTPYDEVWPSRSSYFGICDLAGLPKDRYYLYRSEWNKNAHTIHLLPHWTWPGREGEVTPVYCYTDFPTAELFVNGKSQGRISKQTDAKELICDPSRQSKDERALDRYRLRWNNVKYEPGTLKVVVYDADGKVAGEQTVKTAGKVKELKLSTPHTTIKAGADKLVYITVTAVDRKGNEVPFADNDLEFLVAGNGSFKAACNGDATSLQPFTKPEMKLFSGKAVVILQVGEHAGRLHLVVRDKNNHSLKGDIMLWII